MPIHVGIYEILLLSVVPVLFVLWLWALVECLTKESHEGNTRIVWVLVILLAPGVGALLYLLVRRPQRWVEPGAE